MEDNVIISIVFILLIIISVVSCILTHNINNYNIVTEKTFKYKGVIYKVEVLVDTNEVIKNYREELDSKNWIKSDMV